MTDMVKYIAEIINPPPGRPHNFSAEEKLRALRSLMDVIPDGVETLQSNINRGVRTVHTALSENAETSALMRQLHIKWGNRTNPSSQKKIKKGIKLFNSDPCSEIIRERLSKFIRKQQWPPARG